MSSSTSQSDDLVVPLDDDRARDRELTGGKAAALARAAAAGHRVVEGVVLTTHGTAAIDDGNGEDALAELDRAWKQLSDGGERPVVVRSSSVVEDAEDESMAGRYETVADVTDPDGLRAALDTVLSSRQDVAEQSDGLATDHPIAVLVQRQLSPDWGGVAFGIDPVSGRPDRRVVVAGEGAPEGLVSGTEQGDRWLIDEDDEFVEEPEDLTSGVPEDVVRDVAALVEELSEAIGDPQDIEWAATEDGTVWLLQTRPVTTEVTGTPTGPVFGTGPVAETFPDRLTALERDLWLPPLREAIAHALEVSAVASTKAIESSPVVIDVDGRPAVDLELFGRVERNESPIRDRARRIGASWRLGRLRRALPRAARRVVEQADRALADVDELPEYDSEQLLDLLDNSCAVLRSLHGHEALIGLISDRGDSAVTGSGVGLRALAAARRDGLDDRQAIARDPAILALCAPVIGRPPRLPPTDDLPSLRGGAPPADDPGVLREALRMRVRWVQELTARTAEELGRRLAEQGLLSGPADVRAVSLEALQEAVRSGQEPTPTDAPSDQPLPNRFRLTEDGVPVPMAGSGDEGVAAGGGVAEGPIQLYDGDGDVDAVREDVVLVVDELAPDLAAVLPRLVGLVATTGSPLSHVAILARESGVPAVVGFGNAMDRFEDGQRVRVDGNAGDVESLEEQS